MKVYKIKHASTGKFSRGGMDVDESGTGYGWSSRGKVWTNKQAVSSHLRQYFKRVDMPELGRHVYVNQIPHTWILIEADFDTGITTISEAYLSKPEKIIEL